MNFTLKKAVVIKEERRRKKVAVGRSRDERDLEIKLKKEREERGWRWTDEHRQIDGTEWRVRRRDVELLVRLLLPAPEAPGVVDGGMFRGFCGWLRRFRGNGVLRGEGEGVSGVLPSLCGVQGDGGPLREL